MPPPYDEDSHDCDRVTNRYRENRIGKHESITESARNFSKLNPETRDSRATKRTRRADGQGEVLDEYDDRGDLIECQQLEYRAQIRIREMRALPSDILLHQFHLLSGNEDYAVALKNTPCPSLRSPADVITESLENTSAIDELVVVVCTLIRVYPPHRRMYWQYVALLLESCLQKEDLVGSVQSCDPALVTQENTQSFVLGSINELHMNVRESIQCLVGLLPGKHQEAAEQDRKEYELRRLYLACSHVGSSFLDGIRWDVAYLIATTWLDTYARIHNEQYVSLCQRYGLHESLVFSRVAPDTAVNTVPSTATSEYDARIRKGDAHTQLLEKTLTYLRRVGVYRLHDSETLLAMHTLSENIRHKLRIQRGREPPYVCRVQSGYEWNRYNSTHYDSSNLPPRVVKGYRIDVFYGDLDEQVAKSEGFRPTYQLFPTEAGWDDKECYLVISAGKPFADLIFRIVNRP